MFRIATILVTAASIAVAGCGGSSGSSSSSSAKPTGTPTPAAAKVAQQYLDNYTHHKAKAICSDLGSQVVASMKGARGCLKQVRQSFKVGVFPKLHVKAALANGGTATAVLQDSPRQITLTQEGGAWKVTNGGT